MRKCKTILFWGPPPARVLVVPAAHGPLHAASRGERGAALPCWRVQCSAEPAETLLVTAFEADPCILCSDAIWNRAPITASSTGQSERRSHPIPHAPPPAVKNEPPKFGQRAEEGPIILNNKKKKKNDKNLNVTCSKIKFYIVSVIFSSLQTFRFHVEQFTTFANSFARNFVLSGAVNLCVQV